MSFLTPDATADYLMTGSVNQACREAGTSELVKKMLLEADMADVAMAPAPDMFEMGARVQVLRRGTLYPQRAQKLYDLYRGYASFEAAPAAEREKVEKQILRRSFEEVWSETERYWQERDPRKTQEGRTNPKARMALCFRWYLGMSSRWASSGDESRKADFQVWCGASIGALNRWTQGTALGTLEGRQAAAVGGAILFGAAALARRDAALRAGVQGLPSAWSVCRPPGELAPPVTAAA
jgi:PfaD family protein